MENLRCSLIRSWKKCRPIRGPRFYRPPEQTENVIDNKTDSHYQFPRFPKLSSKYRQIEKKIGDNSEFKGKRLRQFFVLLLSFRWWKMYNRNYSVRPNFIKKLNLKMWKKLIVFVNDDRKYIIFVFNYSWNMQLILMPWTNNAKLKILFHWLLKILRICNDNRLNYHNF